MMFDIVKRVLNIIVSNINVKIIFCKKITVCLCFTFFMAVIIPMYWSWGSTSLNSDTNKAEGYILIDRVYSFSNSNKLLEMIDELDKSNLPFVIAVMPVYENGSYPTMQRFCEILRYAQKVNGTIVLNIPLEKGNDFDYNSVKSAIDTGFNSYEEYGVYPKGLRINDEWEKSKDRMMLAEKYRGVINDENCVAVFDMQTELDRLESSIAGLKKSGAIVKNIRNIVGELPKDEKIYTVEDYEEYDYEAERSENISKDLTKSNYKLMLVTIVSAIIFVVCIIAARRQNRKKFFYKDK